MYGRGGDYQMVLLSPTEIVKKGRGNRHDFITSCWNSGSIRALKWDDVFFFQKSGRCLDGVILCGMVVVVGWDVGTGRAIYILHI